MIASPTSIRPASGSADVRQAFMCLLPAILRYVQYSFRYENPDVRQEATQEALANSFVAFARLVETGRQHIARATPLARFAVAQVRSGRKVGTRLNVRDISSRHCQLSKGVRVERLDRYYRPEDRWKEAVVEDRRAGPDHVVMVRLDFAAWLASLSSRDRRIAEVLATGETGQIVARQFGISEGRVSQLRRQLRDDWHRFQGEPVPA